VKKSLLVIYLTIFIDFIGVGLVIPIFAPLFLSPTSNLCDINISYDVRSFILGLALAVFPFFQFFGAPLLGTLSDKYGRKKILFFSILGTFIGYVLMVFGITEKLLYLIILSRVIDGFSGGNISVATSAISDITDPKDRVKNFGLLGALFGVCFIIGPYLGGKLSDPTINSNFNYATPFLIAAILSFINLILLSFFFRETLSKKIEKKVSLTSGIRNLKKAFTDPKFKVIFTVVFLITCGFSFFTQFFQAYLVTKFNFSEGQIGELFAYIGIWIALTQGLIIRYLPKSVTPKKAVFFGSIILGSALIGLLLPDQAYQIYFVLPFVAIANGILGPNSQAIISNLADEDSQGEIFGINQSITSLGMALAPLISGIIISFGIHLPIITAGILIILAGVIFQTKFKVQL
jgi:DHA1 family tetracycline resistance protein-like MFS transporter